MPAKHQINSLTARVLPEVEEKFRAIAESKRAGALLPKTTKGTLLLSLVEMFMDDQEFQDIFFQKMGETVEPAETTTKPYRYEITSEGELTLGAGCTTLRSCRKSGMDRIIRWRNSGLLQIIETESKEVIEQYKYKDGAFV